MSEFAAWQNYFVVIGSAAGALIGLQFVVMTLIASRPSARVAEAGAAFATPTVVHFTSALVLSALSLAPWHSISNVSMVWDVIGVGGVVYSLIVARRVRSQGAYSPEFEDWLFHVLLPLVAYLILALSAAAASLHPRHALFGVAAAALLLLFVGIHNTWDSVTYHVFNQARKNAGE